MSDDEIVYLACEQFEPYRGFDNLEDALTEIAGHVISGFDFRVAEVKIIRWHSLQIIKEEVKDEDK